jgi:hypothetical protein
MSQTVTIEVKQKRMVDGMTQYTILLNDWIYLITSQKNIARYFQRKKSVTI